MEALHRWSRRGQPSSGGGVPPALLGGEGCEEHLLPPELQAHEERRAQPQAQPQQSQQPQQPQRTLADALRGERAQARCARRVPRGID